MKGGIILDWATIIAAAITAGFAFMGVYISNRKHAALMAYRLEKLEAKVDKHNQMVERMYRLESRLDIIEQSTVFAKKG